MIDLSNLRAPGWNRVVAELATPAGDDRSYLERLLRVIGQVSASKQACLLLPQAGDAGAVVARVIAAWPGKSQAGGANGAAVESGATIAVEHEREVKQAAIGVFESAQSRAFAFDEQGGVYDGNSSTGGGTYLLAVPVPDGTGRAAAAVTLLIESRSRAAVQSTLAMAEVLAGYVHGHTARSELKRQQASVMALELATRLLSAVNTQTSFKGATLQLVNDLTRQLGADRAALGWVKGNSIEVVALSDAEDFNKRTEMIRKLAGAMDECLDQEQAVVFPVPEAGQDVLLAHAIVAAHRELAATTPGLVVCSVPLRRARRLPGETSTTEETIGVITVELRSPAPQPGQQGKQAIDTRGVEVLQSAADLLGPVLATRWSDDRVLPLRAVDAAKRSASWLVGPTHTPWKVAGVLLIAAFIFCSLFKIEHRVGSSATLEATGRRVIAAPFDGVVASLGPGVKPGAKVKAGEVLAELDTRELKLQMSSAMARREQGERQLANARKEGKVAESQMAQAAVDRAAADANLLSRRIELSKLTAPADGVILAGDLQDKIGAAVKVGDSLMQIAPLADLYVLARVDERDVGLIKDGGTGEIRLKAEPGEGHRIIIEAIVPLAVAKDGKNEFEVRGRLNAVPEWMRPGMEGVARLDAGRRSLLWIGTRRVIDTVRLWLW